jgi:hypothetical protein
MSNATVVHANAALSATLLNPNSAAPLPSFKFGILNSLRQWLDGLDINQRRLAWFLYKAIPGQCPFERDIVLFGRTVAHIPPLCKLNPLYDQFVGLRFRAMCYLADVCGEAL